MHIVRYLRPGGTGAVVGVLDGGLVAELGVESLGSLLRLALDEARDACEQARSSSSNQIALGDVLLLPPVDGRMEVWAAGVTYRTSKIERMRESERAGSVYDLVYDAARPELFFKSAAWRVVGDNEPISVREDSTIDVPEPELAVVLNAGGEVFGYTICDDVSSRSIEGENPLYLPQAKLYLGSCALGPSVRPSWEVADPLRLDMRLSIKRGQGVVFDGRTSTAEMHRSLEELVSYLLRAEVFPDGVVLSTGTSLVPPLPFSLAEGDVVRIEIEEIGSLVNPVVRGKQGLSWLLDALGDPAARGRGRALAGGWGNERR